MSPAAAAGGPADAPASATPSDATGWPRPIDIWAPFGEPAGLGRRLAARLLDVLAVTAVAVLPVAAVLLAVQPTTVNPLHAHGSLRAALIVLELTPLVIAVVYRLVVDADGRSFGRAAAGLRLVRLDGNGGRSQQPVGHGRGLARLLTSTAGDLALGAGTLSSLWQRHRRSWADRVGGTAVVRDSDVRPPNARSIVALLAAVAALLVAPASMVAPGVFSGLGSPVPASTPLGCDNGICPAPRVTVTAPGPGSQGGGSPTAGCSVQSPCTGVVQTRFSELKVHMAPVRSSRHLCRSAAPRQQRAVGVRRHRASGVRYARYDRAAQWDRLVAGGYISDAFIGLGSRLPAC